MTIKNYFKVGATVTEQIFVSPKMSKIALFYESFRNFRKIQNTPLDNALSKVCTKIHEATMIRKHLNIGASVIAPRAKFSKSQIV